MHWFFSYQHRERKRYVQMALYSATDNTICWVCWMAYLLCGIIHWFMDKFRSVVCASSNNCSFVVANEITFKKRRTIQQSTRRKFKRMVATENYGWSYGRHRKRTCQNQAHMISHKKLWKSDKKIYIF